MSGADSAALLPPDHRQRVVVDSTAMAWTESPSPGVWRKRLEHFGPPERGRVTSLVRYDAGTEFPFHKHPEGEEFLVLEGTFEDQNGRYPAGSFVLNPDGTSHAPWTDDGCLLFVKLRQFAGADRTQAVVDTDALDWQPGSAPGHTYKMLYAQDGYPEVIRLVRFEAGARAARHAHPGGEEIYILEGSLKDENGTYGAGTWARFPDASMHEPISEDGCLLYIRTGALPAE